jgi:hypothetical protein
MEDQNEDNFEDVSFMPRRHWMLKIGGISVAVALLALVAWGLAETNKDTNLTFQGNRRATDVKGREATPLRESSYKDPSSPVATNGEGTSNASAPAAAEPIQDLKGILGTDDPRSLTGRRVEITVPVLQDQNLTTFWIGSPQDKLLVVLNRDTRDSAERQASTPPEHGIGAVHQGQHAVITGTVVAVPRAEERYNWDLTRPQTQELERRGVYIRADKITAAGDGH